VNLQRKRPLGITLLALLFLWIGCLGTLIFPIMILTGGVGQTWNLIAPNLIHSHALNPIAASLFSLTWYAAYVLYAFIGFGLWKLRKWALRAVTIVQWIGLAGGLIGVIVAARIQPVLAISFGIGTLAPFGGLLWYLKRSHVRYAFEPQTDHPVISFESGPPPPPLPPSQSTPQRKVWVQVTIALGICVAFFALFGGSIFFAVEKMFHSSDAYKMALSRAQTSPCIIDKLGSPLVAKWMTSGNLSENGSGGSADFEIPLRGPLGEGELDVSATKNAGSWTITSLSLIHDQGQIHLLPVASPCQ
jgi:hypothetical protein